MRSTAVDRSYSGCAGSAVESSIDNPATPLSTARRTLSSSSPGVRAKPDPKVRIHGHIGRIDDLSQVLEHQFAWH